MVDNGEGGGRGGGHYKMVGDIDKGGCHEYWKKVLGFCVET